MYVFHRYVMWIMENDALVSYGVASRSFARQQWASHSYRR